MRAGPPGFRFEINSNRQNIEIKINTGAEADHHRHSDCSGKVQRRLETAADEKKRKKEKEIHGL